MPRNPIPDFQLPCKSPLRCVDDWRMRSNWNAAQPAALSCASLVLARIPNAARTQAPLQPTLYPVFLDAARTELTLQALFRGTFLDAVRMLQGSVPDMTLSARISRAS